MTDRSGWHEDGAGWVSTLHVTALDDDEEDWDDDDLEDDDWDEDEDDDLDEDEDWDEDEEDWEDWDEEEDEDYTGRRPRPTWD